MSGVTGTFGQGAIEINVKKLGEGSVWRMYQMKIVIAWIDRHENVPLASVNLYSLYYFSVNL